MLLVADDTSPDDTVAIPDRDDHAWLPLHVADRYAGPMSKTTPLRLNDELLRQAKQKGARSNRSAAAQIERWALVGRVMEGAVTDGEIEAVAAGLARVRIISVDAPPAPELDEVLADLDALRDSGELSAQVAGPVRYRASADGGIERVSAAGVERGTFVDGAFVPTP